MDLWIRSQDKTELFHPTSIWMVKDENAVWCQYGLNKTCIAIYKSEERALEVLDEIQNHLENQDTVTAQINTDGEVVNQICYKKIFEMPKE